MRAQAEERREKLIEAVADADEELMEKYLEGEAISRGRDPRRRSARARSRMKLVPVLCGSAFKNKGVQPLLDAVVDYLPSPLDVPPVEGIDPDTRATRSTRAGAATTSRSRRWRSRS